MTTSSHFLFSDTNPYNANDPSRRVVRFIPLSNGTEVALTTWLGTRKGERIEFVRSACVFMEEVMTLTIEDARKEWDRLVNKGFKQGSFDDVTDGKECVWNDRPRLGTDGVYSKEFKHEFPDLIKRFIEKHEIGSIRDKYDSGTQYALEA